MSKTVDDLVKVYIIAHFGADNGPRNRERYRAGIAAVVRALREEFENEMGKCLDCSASGVHDHLDEVFSRILGDAGEKVAGGPSSNEDTVTAPRRAAPATASAPAVCEWIDQVKGMAWAGCNKKLYPIKSAVNGCNGCGLPIKFTEVK